MRQNDRGSVPFALIATAILLISATICITASCNRESNDDIDSSKDDLDSIDAAKTDVLSYVNCGLGDLVRIVSTTSEPSDLKTRANEFRNLAEQWIEYQFPMTSHGATIHQTGYAIELNAMPSSFFDSKENGYIPAHLKGTGTISVSIESQSSRLNTELEIYTDGSYSLPLAMERAVLFESMAADGGITLSQMMSGQLAALAEYRIINGYGGLAAYGDKGTNAILTDDDVEEAFKWSMDALTAICFRDGPLSTADSVDLAERLATQDGSIEIDLSAVYAQALASSVDDLILRWMDYLYGYEIVESLCDRLMPHKKTIEALKRFISGERGVSGVPYLKDAMESVGLTEDAYRYPGSGTTTVHINGMTIHVENPTRDLFSQEWLTKFKRHYDEKSESNYVEKLLRDTLNAAASEISERMDLGTVVIEKAEGIPFMDAILDGYRNALDGCHGAIEESISSALSASRSYDVFLGSMADEIQSHASDFEDIGTLKDRIREALISESEKTGVDEDESTDIDILMDSKEVQHALNAYVQSVRSDMTQFERLKSMDGGDDGILKKLLKTVFVYGLGLIDPVFDKSKDMMAEMAWMDGTNPYNGDISLPGNDVFELVEDESENTIEYLSLTLDTSNASFDATIDGGIHTVGFGSNPHAAYATTFKITVDGQIGYTVTGTGALSGAMNSLSSMCRGGFAIHVDTNISVSSGWGLSGVEYEPSTTAASDLTALALRILEPILEPLQKMLEAVRSALATLVEMLAEAAEFVTSNLMALYQAYMEPIEAMNRMITEYVEQALADSVLDLLVDIGLGAQSITLEMCGFTLELETSAVTFAAKTKSVLSAVITAPIADLVITAGIVVKLKGDWNRDNLIISGIGGIEGSDWSIETTVDPLMKGSKYLFTVNGKVGKNRISLVAPKLEEYNEFGIALSDVPGMGQVLNNIPIPGLGVNLGLDAGFQIRCKAPTQNGVLINEYESNPEGTDRGNEWIEICNNGPSSVDLTGWKMVLKAKGKYMEKNLEGVIGPGEFLVLEPPSILVNSPSSDRLILKDPSGDSVDEIKLKKDTSNDGTTWQREYDGSPKWIQKDGTKGSSNGSFVSTEINVESLKGCAWKGVEKAFDKVGSITDVDSLTEFMKYLTRYTVEEIIALVSGMIIDASVFVSIDAKDATSSLSTGIRIALRTDGDLAKDCLKYLAGQIGSMLLDMKNPYRIDPVEMFTENIDLEVMYHTGIGFPEILSDGGNLPKMDMGVLVRTNLSSLTRIIGEDTGRPEIEFGIMLRDCPSVAIPHKLKVRDDMEHDLWLFKATVVLCR